MRAASADGFALGLTAPGDAEAGATRLLPTRFA
jgi:hypothetical protein